MAHTLLSVSTQGGSETSEGTTGPQALGFPSSQRFSALSTVSYLKGPCGTVVHQQDPVQSVGQLLR